MSTQNLDVEQVNVTIPISLGMIRDNPREWLIAELGRLAYDALKKYADER